MQILVSYRMGYRTTRMLLVTLFGVILSASSQDTDGQPLVSHASMFNITPYEADMQPLGIRIGESLLPTDIDDTLNRHNNLRENANPQSSDMEYMSWDNELAYMAQVWAEGCRFVHGNPPNVSPYTQIGQNIWAHTGDRDNPLSPVGATQDWYDEVYDYDYNSNTCQPGKVCGHYTQVVWAKTNKVGCGRVFCPSVSFLRNAWYVVCNYAPAGNYQGQKPYRLGSPCTQCESGIGECYNGLCRRCSDHNERCVCAQKCQNCGQLDTQQCSCTCTDGWWGADCSRECVDTHRYCNANPGWPGPSSCGWAPYIPLECPLMCGLCKGGDRSATCVEPTGDGNNEDPLCNLKYTAFTFIDGKFYAFQGSKLWRFRGNGRLISNRKGDKAKKFFKKLPKSPAGAFVYANGNVGFVKGSMIYVYSGKTLVSGYPKTLESLGLPKNFKAAFHRPDEGKGGKTYFMKGDKVWRYDEAKERLDSAYPKLINGVFPGLRSDPSGAFHDGEGTLHVVFSKKYFTVSEDNSISSKSKPISGKLRIPDC